MSASSPEAAPASGRGLPGWFDPSPVFFGLIALLLAFVVLLPFGWLALFSLTDEKGAFSMENFSELGDPSLFLGPFVTTLGIALGVGVLACGVVVRSQVCVLAPCRKREST